MLGRARGPWGGSGEGSCLGAAADTGVLLLHFQYFLYQIGSKLTLPGRAHVSSWQPGPAQLAGSAQSHGPTAAGAGSRAEPRSELGSALMDKPKAGGLPQAPNPVLDPASLGAITPLRSWFVLVKLWANRMKFTSLGLS